MKNKKSTIGLMLLLAGSLVLTNCTKNKTNTPPAPEKETETVAEVVNTQMIISDIHEICGQICEANNPLPRHDGTPLSITVGTANIASNLSVNSPGVSSYTLTFSNTVGQDGHVRNGALVFDYSASPSLSQYFYRIPTFIVNVSSIGYSVDNYSVAISKMKIVNTTQSGFPSLTVNPSNTNLTWSNDLDVAVSSAAGVTTFKGTINKTLLNTATLTAIPMPPGSITTYSCFGFVGSNNNYLYMKNQWVSYTGTGTGTLADGTAYTFDITTPVTRNMVSSPEKAVVLNGYLISMERHPFLTGTATFKPGLRKERYINFGDAGDVVDYNTKVTIDGITYAMDIK